MGVIDDAVRLEEQAEKNYRQAADRAQNPSATKLLVLLADAEAGHAMALRRLDAAKDLKGPDLVAAASAWVRGVVEGGANTLSRDGGLLNLLRRAMDLERQTEAFYREHAEGADDARIARLLGELAQIERSHYALVSSLVEYYNRPNEWVESAEFGLRPDY
jgi:rubrerythrin